MKKAPHPKLLSIPGLMRQANREPFELLRRLQREYGDIVRLHQPRLSHLICHPDHLQHLFKTNASNYTTRGKDFYEIHPLVGDGVLLSNGELWTRQRRTVAKEFHPATVRLMAEAMVEHTARLLDEWEGNLSVEREMTREMMTLTLNIAADVFFGTHVDDARIIAEAVHENMSLAARRVRALVKLPRHWKLPAHRRADEAIRRMDERIYSLIAQYEREKPARTNVMSRLMAARGEGSERMTDRTLRDEIVTLLLSGHETTASTLFWTLYCLAQEPAVEAKLVEEIRAVLGDRPPTFDDLAQLPYSKMVIQETLRLYPAFANLSKEVAKDDEIGGYHIPGGSLMNVAVYLTHRHPDFWDDPESYDPERFRPEKIATRHPYAHVPFGKGPRACIGEHFAMVEGQIILVMLYQRFRYQLLPPPVVPVARITIYPRDGIRMRVEKRS